MVLESYLSTNSSFIEKTSKRLHPFALDIDDCDGVDCQHGQCVDDVNAYICNCNEGYKGTHCEIGKLSL